MGGGDRVGDEGDEAPPPLGPPGEGPERLGRRGRAGGDALDARTEERRGFNEPSCLDAEPCVLASVFWASCVYNFALMCSYDHSFSF